MSCNLIQIQGGKKVARPITSEEEYRQLRGTSAQLANLRLARNGNAQAKMRLVQMNYSGHYPEGVVKGTKLPSKAFGFDIDDTAEFEKVVAMLLDGGKPTELAARLGLLMLERSVNQGGHAVFKREMGKTDGKHAFSFTPEADTVAQKWRSSMSDFSTMLRQSYDGSRYDREAKSADATTVHIDHLLWNVCMCGTPDALYRVINNYTDGLLSRFIIAHTPDNTFAPLEDKPNLMTDKLRDRIQQIAHLLPLMQGTLNLPKLEERSRQWVEKVRREALKDDDRVMARARLRDHGTAVRMAACLILCAVAEKLIKQHGLSGAEKQLKMRPSLTAEMAAKMQTPAMLDAYEVIAESLIDNDMLYFREKLENANQNTGISSDRKRGGKNDRIYDRLSDTFTFEQAMGAKGNGCTHNSVRQMLKNWRKQGLIKQVGDGHYQKING